MFFSLFNQSFFYFLAALLIVVTVSPLLIFVLKKLGVTRRDTRDFSALIPSRASKSGTPVMGGLAIIFAVALLTIIFNWHRGTTFVPIGAFLLSALLGGMDDLLNIFGLKERHVRTVGMALRLVRVHKSFLMRLWHAFLLPWYAYKRLFYLLGSHPGKGIQAHEKIIIQLIVGVAIAWWLSWKLEWTSLWLPWIGQVDIGLWIAPLTVLFVMFMANAVNITDGIDGLSAGTLAISYGAFFVIALGRGAIDIAFLIASVIGALAGYLLFNIQPARYQMGDVGSLSLGVLLAAMAAALDREVLLLVVGIIFVVEIMSVIFQTWWRVFIGKRFLKMAPLHHHLEYIGWSEARIVMYAWTIAILAAIAGLWLSLN